MTITIHLFIILIISVDLESGKGTLFPALVPNISPIGWTDTHSILPKDCAFLGISSSLLDAKEPFIIAIPAVKRLVRGREPMITWSCSNVLDLVQQIFLLFGKSRNLGAENL
jgi:hypothetical protein